jgi:hypothetical protein
MMLAPWLSITSQAAPSAPSSLWTILAILVPQAVTVGIFYKGLREARRKDRKARKQERQRDRQAIADHREKERESMRLNLKREVLLEVAPAIQRNFISLATAMELHLEISQVTTKIRRDLDKSINAISKLQMVASSETLEAARQLQTYMGLAFLRLLKKRLGLGDRRDFGAFQEISAAWKEEVVAYPKLLVDFVALARQELHLPFDRQQFLSGVVEAQMLMLQEIEDMASTYPR